MKPHHLTSQQQRWQSAFFGVRWFLSVLLSLAIFLGQASSAMAGHDSGSSSIWIEICSDGGSYFIQIDEDGEGKAPECNHCVFCLVPAGETQGDMFTSFGGAELPEVTLISYLSDQVLLPDSPEQYWSACRGPPIASIEKTMTTLASLSGKTPVGIALNTWSHPCV